MVCFASMAPLLAGEPDPVIAAILDDPLDGRPDRLRDALGPAAGSTMPLGTGSRRVRPAEPGGLRRLLLKIGEQCLRQIPNGVTVG